EPRDRRNRGRLAGAAHHRDRDRRAVRVPRLPADLEGPQHAPHAAHVRHERHPRHRPARRPAGDRRRRGLRQRPDPRDRDRVRHDQRRRRLPRHGPDARDVQAQGPAAGSAGSM
ncbi:MAG: NAD(P) transhydrogenase alpha subunit, partial [uncultured Solirubrobacteraceae bacterium]